VGVYTVKAAKEVGASGLVIAVEPFIETASRLSLNVMGNGFHNVRVRNFCIGEKTEHSVLHLNNGRPNCYSLVPRNSVQSVSVLSVSIDDLCKWENLDRLDYLKIDAEGAEAAILDGGLFAIGRFRPIVQVEITIRKSTLSDGYRRFSAPNSMNHVFIPAEKVSAIETAMQLGWMELSPSNFS
jgi:FkbM family methyltransferase